MIPQAPYDGSPNPSPDLILFITDVGQYKTLKMVSNVVMLDVENSNPSEA